MPNIHTQKPGRGWGYSIFQVAGMIEGFFWVGVETFDSRIFVGTKIWQVFFWVGKFKKGFLWLFRIIRRFVEVPV